LKRRSGIETGRRNWLFRFPIEVDPLPESLFCKRFPGAGFKISLQLSGVEFGLHPDIASQPDRKGRTRGHDFPLLVRTKSPLKIVRGTDVNIAIAELEKIDVPHGPPAPRLRWTPY
jgi:hypothetical protein